MPRLARINIYPVKSLDGQAVDETALLPSGGLQHDRRFAILDRAGDVVNGKRTPALHRLRSHFDPASGQLTLSVDGQSHKFDTAGDRRELTAWLTDFLGQELSIVENTIGGFPDDVEFPGPTVISTATLAEVASWFDGLSVEETRDRFRANLEIDADEPFWEDRLLAEGTGVVRFQVGGAELVGTNPCARCPVPTRNPYTGESMPHFGGIFARRRQESLPPWAPASRFDHFYRLAVNTRPVHGGPCVLRVGDEVRIVGSE